MAFPGGVVAGQFYVARDCSVALPGDGVEHAALVAGQWVKGAFHLGPDLN